MNLAQAVAALLIFPGLLYALPMGWLMLGTERKLRARFQGRIGPPVTQPFYDLIKLIAKFPLPRAAGERALLAFFPLLSMGAMIGAAALLPVFRSESGFAGTSVFWSACSRSLRFVWCWQGMRRDRFMAKLVRIAKPRWIYFATYLSLRR